MILASDDEHEPDDGNREEKIISKFLLASLSTLAVRYIHMYKCCPRSNYTYVYMYYIDNEFVVNNVDSFT